MEFVIASDIYHDDLFADIRYRDSYWAQVAYDAGKDAFILTIFPGMNTIKNPDGNYVFDLTEVQTVLERAKTRLMELGYGAQE